MKMMKTAAMAAALCLACTALPLRAVSTPGSLTVSAAEEAEEYTYGVLTYIITDGAIQIKSCDKTAETVEIPSEIDGLPVTSIGSTAFYSCSLTSVAIPEGVTSIGAGAFWHCKSMTEISIPSTVTSIGNYAFADCQLLTSVEIPEGVTEMMDSVFADCAALTDIRFPQSLTYIGQTAFKNTPWLAAQKEADPFVAVNGILVDASQVVVNLAPEGTIDPDENPVEVVIPDGITAIGKGVFADKASSVTSVTTPASVTRIFTEAFNKCTKLKYITITENATDIGDDAFKGTLWLSEQQSAGPLVVLNSILIDGSTASGDVVIPDGVTAIRGNAFRVNANITSVVIPEGVTTIGDAAFYSCTALASVSLPQSLRTIGEEAFFDCAITELTIPQGVEEIGYAAFISCKQLAEATIYCDDALIADEAFGWTAIFTLTGQYSYDVIHTVNKDFILRCREGSAGEAYVSRYGMVTEYLAALGDVTEDGEIDANDATTLLCAAAEMAAGNDAGLDADQLANADMNCDGTPDANDATEILVYAAEAGAGLHAAES